MKKYRLLNGTARLAAAALACAFMLGNQAAGASLNRTKTTLAVGGTERLRLEGAGKGTKIKWRSSNRRTATVSSSGKIKAKRTGKTKITAVSGGKRYSCVVTVKRMSLTGKASMTVGESKRLSVKGLPKGTKAKWTSSKPSTVSIGTDGVARALKAGTATVKAKCGGRTFSCRVTAKKAKKKGKALKTSSEFHADKETTVSGALTMSVGAKWTLPGGRAGWTSSNPKSASVTPAGEIRALKTGSALLKGKVGAKTYLWTVKVSQDSVPTSKTPSPSEAAVKTKILSFKSKYPEGTSFGNEKYYGWGAGLFSGGYGCAAFAFELSDAAFGDRQAVMLMGKDVDAYETIRAGDSLRLDGDSHTVVVIEKKNGKVVVAEANYGGKVHWGRAVPKSEVNACSYLVSRY